MRSSFRTAHLRRASFGQLSLAVMLLLVLLASIAPIGSLASHGCQMACCVGKSPHAEGSCSVAFMSEENVVVADDQGDEHSAHHHAGHSSAQQSSAKKDSPQAASIASRIVTTPCSPECAAAASASTRSPRPRETAALSAAAAPRPPTLALFQKDYSKVLPSSAERRRQIRPRAPPISPVNIPA